MAPLAIAKAAIPVAMTMFLAALLLSARDQNAIGAVLAVAAVPILVRGTLMLALQEEVLAPLAERERRGIGGRVGLHRETKFGAVLLLMIGIGWAVVGLLTLVGAL